ncbi:hypothetical protein ABBQ32_008394 [Trebouxia sp. C0010 RCD-2024]
MNSTALWFGNKACRPATTKQKRRGWSLEDVTVGSYVCFEADETSEYWLAGFELGKVLTVPSDLTDEAKLQVDYHQFDPTSKSKKWERKQLRPYPDGPGIWNGEIFGEQCLYGFQDLDTVQGADLGHKVHSKTILQVLEDKSVGFKRHEAAAGPFANMDTMMLTGLNIKMLSAIKRAQQQQQQHQGIRWS